MTTTTETTQNTMEDTTEQSFNGPSSSSCREPSPLKHDSPTPATSTLYNSIGVSDDDDVSSSTSHTDVSSTCDVTCTDYVVQEKPNRDDEENVCDVGLATSDAATHPQMQDGAHDPFQDFNHSHSLSANGDDIERVQQTETRQKGSEVKVRDISMAGLVPQLPTLAVNKVKAVPVSRHFYNQWARVPRLDDPEGDVTTTSSARKPLSMRTFTVTGSLKSYTLMKAIVRDKGSPIQSLTDLFQTRYTSSPPERTRERNDAAGLERSLSDTVLTKDRGVTQTTQWASSHLQENHSFPPISDPRARTAPDAGKEEDGDDDDDDDAGLAGGFDRKPQSKLPSATVSCSSFSFDRLPASAEVKKRPVSQLNPRRLCSSSFCGGFPAAPGLLRPVQTLSVNTASLLFASTVDMREQYYKQLIQKHPRGLVIKATPQWEATREKEKPLKSGDPRTCSDTGQESSRPREATRVEFIDFGEVKSAPPRASKAIERWSGKKKSGGGGGGGGDVVVVGGRPATASKRALLSEADPRHDLPCDRLNARRFLTVGMTAPIHHAFAK